jgi:hypothetical protein
MTQFGTKTQFSIFIGLLAGALLVTPRAARAQSGTQATCTFTVTKDSQVQATFSK